MDCLGLPWRLRLWGSCNGGHQWISFAYMGMGLERTRRLSADTHMESATLMPSTRSMVKAFAVEL